MAKEGISPAGHAGFESDISAEETANLLQGFLEALLEEQRRGRPVKPSVLPSALEGKR